MLTEREQNEFRIITESAGAIFKGIQVNSKGIASLILFDEPKYGSTLALSVKSFTKQNVKSRLRNTVRLFRSCETKF